MFVYLFNFSFGKWIDAIRLLFSFFFQSNTQQYLSFLQKEWIYRCPNFPKQNFMYVTECDLILWKSSARKFPNFPKFWKFSSGNLTPTPDSFPTSIFHMLSQCRYDNLIFLGQKMNLQKNMYIFLTLTKPWITVESSKVIHRWMEVLAINRN